MTTRILAISGSLRRTSLNTNLLRQAEAIAGRGATFDYFDRLPAIPLFSEDEEHPAPAPVADLRDRVRTADAVLIATPEYNASIPAGLKNALDWLSRSDSTGGPALVRKPVAIMGASGGQLGTVRAQLALRQVLHSMSARVLDKPELLLFRAHEQFDESGVLPEGSRAHAALLGILDGLADLVTQRGTPHPATR
ncbi:NADPH-dependent FMN reductase [Kutzneria sp. NPDC052558]|uniref:NADPH-dependent FMN reductase n=1 Tax=Kutzneria sp. NPDC052558 TaxID=3364121 RepID=UPI0037C75C26